MTFDIGCEVIEITILESWDRDRRYKLQGRRLLGFKAAC
jgi:hypothetical protein